VIRKTMLVLFALAVVLAVSTASVLGQNSEVKEKPRMYSYVANWTIPRAQWGDVEKAGANTQSLLEKALADGTLVGYGSDENLVHEKEGFTHDSWWSSMSLAGLMNVLDQIYKSGGASNPAFSAATKHWDNIYVSRYYNWHAGTWRGAYTYVSSYKLKADAPDDAVDQLAKNLIVPVMEKVLTDGTIHEYEIDTQAVHTQAPGTFIIVYIGANAESLDKVNATIRESFKANPMGGPAFSSYVDYTDHRDELSRTNATFK
jgi:hypothetical protein